MLGLLGTYVPRSFIIQLPTGRVHINIPGAQRSRSRWNLKRCYVRPCSTGVAWAAQLEPGRRQSCERFSCARVRRARARDRRERCLRVVTATR